MTANSSLVVDDILAKDVIGNGSVLVLGPPMQYDEDKASIEGGKTTHSAIASDQPSPIPPASVVCRHRPVPPPVILLVMPWVF